MNTATLNALNQSIEHWERLSEGKEDFENGEDVYAEHCALCKMFNAEKDSGCKGCPVAEAGFRNCGYSPWIKAEEDYLDYGPGSIEFMASAKLQLEFLKSLLPVTQSAPSKGEERTV